ncbi:hypothetical protein MMUR_11840 [Mycolicibacterium murale]|uniref:Glycosyl transferase family 1 n=1 Tax=Mycolicibacterium murale TaxID=182220 RepID=A0A7I9WI75_9MYCO|nr:hypothetical protein [Mycolicibacterium murale]ANW66877.1 hypothetical protein BCA37_27830 [Mycobacterium sp. djl-10]MCV7180825.1 hypothetical protein [Mycolicibacterium murale]GFG57048.1 hypothetical protein MMUR_11840 [Mycolicibacterium murale]
MTATVTHLVVGPPRHGVVQFGLDLHTAMVAAGAASQLVAVEHPDEVHWATPPAAVHLQFTDRLFGTSPEQAAATVSTIVAPLVAAGCRVTATLHDLPQPSDGRNAARRAQAYAAVCADVHAVVVSSEHERLLLGADAPPRTAVIPLPVHTVTAEPVVGEALSVGIFGYVYPGKGHHEVLSALGELGSDAELVAIGAPSDGHADLVDDLQQRAREWGVRFRITGYVTDRLPELLQAITVPVVAHRHISASGSLNNWLGLGRRPLAPAHRYTEEIARRNPDAVQLYPDTEFGLRSALQTALATPASTWLPASTVCRPTARDAALEYARTLRQWYR